MVLRSERQGVQWHCGNFRYLGDLHTAERLCYCTQ